MLVKIISAGLLLAFCAATRLQYPEKDPCILIDVEADNSLSWKHENETTSIPNWDFHDSEVFEGNCSEPVPYLEVIWSDNGTMRFNFNNNSNMVTVKMLLSFVPEKAFANYSNTDNSTVDISVSMKAGSVGRAYKCNSEEDIKGSSKSKDYDMTLRLRNLKIQGFGVENGSYSKADECDQDVTTIAPNSTTEAPNTTVTVRPITTSAPKTAPKVYLNATDGNRTCAMVVGEMTLTIPYTDKDNKSLQATVFVTDDVQTIGTCGTNSDTLLATFHGGFEMFFVFGTDNSKIWWDMLNVTVVYDNVTFPNMNAKYENISHTFQTNFSKAFQTSKDGSYLCNADTTTDLSDSLKLKTTHFQYTAFQYNVTSFSDKNVADCDVKTSSIVPIAVGAALAGLVVIVLIAYLIGRRRNRKGYESV